MFTGSLSQSAMIMGIGLAAGLIGGLTGLGGSLIMLPGLALLIGFSDAAHTEQHVYQAAAMAVNFFVAVPATWRHTGAGTVRRSILVRLLPIATVCIVLGALASDRFSGDVLVRILAVVIVVMVVLGEVSHALKEGADELSEEERIRKSTPVIWGTGVATGFLGGLLGLGGGVVTVISLSALGRIHIRQAIAASTAAMCLMSPIGCATKMMSLGKHGHGAMEAVQLVGLLAPAAVVGSLVGASLVHRLPARHVRRVVAVVLLVAAARLGGLI